jgi:hypothetical protein
MGASIDSSWIPTIAAVVAAFVGFVLAWLFWRSRNKRSLLEATTGMRLLDEMRWRELALLLLQALRARGYESAGKEHAASESGFDLVVQRGSEKYLVVCRHGSSAQIGVVPVRDLLALMTAQNASGAIFFTTGTFDPAALEIARLRPIQLLEGVPMWRELRSAVPLAVLDKVSAVVSARWREGLLVQAGCAGIAAVLAYVGAAIWLRQHPPVPAAPAIEVTAPATPAPTETPVQKPIPVPPAPAVVATAPSPVAATPAPAAAPPPPTSVAVAPAPAPPQPVSVPPPATTLPAPVPVTTTAPPPVVPAPPSKPGVLPDLTPAQEAQRRVDAADKVRTVAGISSAAWSTKSTLALALTTKTAADREEVVNEVCKAVLNYEELRYTRLEISNLIATTESEKRVRWHQCN